MCKHSLGFRHIYLFLSVVSILMVLGVMSFLLCAPSCFPRSKCNIKYKIDCKMLFLPEAYLQFPRITWQQMTKHKALVIMIMGGHDMALETILDCWFLVSPKSQSQGAALNRSALRPGPGRLCLFFFFAFVSFQLHLQNVEHTMALIRVGFMLPALCLQGKLSIAPHLAPSDFKEPSTWWNTCMVSQRW